MAEEKKIERKARGWVSVGDAVANVMKELERKFREQQGSVKPEQKADPK